MSVFNKILKSDPTYVSQTKSTFMHMIHITSKSNPIKIKFAKYQLMQYKECFYKAQRLFHVLSRFIQRVKTNRFTVFSIDHDLRMVPFETNTAIQLAEHKCIYKFNIYDLINLIYASLTQQFMMFADPRFPKNPYTNLDLSINNLYNIYIKCIECKIRVPEILQLFYISDFNVDVLKERYKNVLIETSINNYFSKDLVVTDEVFQCIREMCDPHNINIHVDYPQNELYQIFRPYLKCFFRSKLLTGDNEIFRLLDCFDLYNPFFGKKYMTDFEVRFDNRHLEFQELKNGLFKTMRNVAVYAKISSCKYKYSDHYCISLQPLDNVTYLDFGESYDDDENYSSEED